MSLTPASTYKLLHCETKREQEFFIVLCPSQKTIPVEAIAVDTVFLLLW